MIQQNEQRQEALRMEESAYYPLFVASAWLCWRVLVRGRWDDAAACALALGLTYFAKPLAVPLVAEIGRAHV